MRTRITSADPRCSRNYRNRRSAIFQDLIVIFLPFAHRNRLIHRRKSDNATWGEHMKIRIASLFTTSMAIAVLIPLQLSAQSGPIVQAQRADTNANVIPVNTMVVVTPVREISSQDMREGTTREFIVAEDIVENGYVVIPRGAQVEATVTWRTGKGIVGKSAKFELSFDWVSIDGHNWRLRGSHRQEGRGNTVGALLGAAFITGRSAVMIPGQTVNVFTNEPIPFATAPQQVVPASSTAENPAARPERRAIEIRIETQ